jgi:hypothetical protein
MSEREFNVADVREGVEQIAEGREEKKSQATRLVELATHSDAELFHAPDATPYATFSVDGSRQTHRLRSKSFRGWLASRLWEAEKKAPGSQAIQDALGVLEGMALYDGDERSVFVRLAEHDDAIYLDLGDETWQVVAITPTGWRVMSDPSVRFRRPSGLTALPRPERGGSVHDLRRFLNPGITDEDFILTASWLVGALRPRGPYPALHLSGEHGTAKSSEARVLRELVDPNASELRAEPRSERDLAIAADNAWLIAFDNLSHISQWLSDALCRLATGGGLSTRMLYTDDEERIFEAKRPILLTGIEEVATRADLLDRLIIRQLPVIPDGERVEEEEFWPAWQAARPRILGALLDALAYALRRLPEVKLAELPRMADFAKWACAAAPALGWNAEEFLRAYERNRGSVNDVALEGSLIAEPVRLLAGGDADGPGFQGTASELLEQLEPLAGDEVIRRKGWPGSAKALSSALKRIAPNLRAVGVEVERRREAGRRLIAIWNRAAFLRHGASLRHATQESGDANGSDGDANRPSVTQTVPQNVPDDGCDANAGHFSNNGRGYGEPPNGQVELLTERRPDGHGGDGGLSREEYKRRIEARNRGEEW